MALQSPPADVPSHMYGVGYRAGEHDQLERCIARAKEVAAEMTKPFTTPHSSGFGAASVVATLEAMREPDKEPTK